MKGVGWILLFVTTGFVVWQWDALSFLSLGLGAAVVLALFSLLLTIKTKEPVPLPNPWEGRFRELDNQTALTIEELNQQTQKLQQKLTRSDERCLSYQNLVEVHQSEIDKLKADHHHLVESVIQKERQINTLKFAHLQPDLFDTEKRTLEVAYKELKKECEEARLRVMTLENELLALQAEKPSRRAIPSESTLTEQLRTAEEENQRLQAELISLQQLVTELSLPEGCD